MKHVFLGIILSISSLSLIASCCSSEAQSRIVTAAPTDGNYRREMREFVEGISEYARTTANSSGSTKTSFIVIPQNGQEVAWNQDAALDSNGFPSGDPDATYMKAIDGCGREDTFFGYEKDNVANTDAESTYFETYCDKFLTKGKTVLSIDYCSSSANIISSYTKNNGKGYIGFAEPDRELRIIPEQVLSGTNSVYDKTYYPYNTNTNSISSLSDAKNFLFILNSEKFVDTDGISGSAFVTALKKTDYDVLIIDAYASDGNQFTKTQIESLKIKKDGGTRLVIAYMSIGEAETYRSYWNESWISNGSITSSAPAWLDEENKNWAGNYKVRYWDSDWQAIIYGNDSSYTKKLIDAGFDGVYLDIIDAFQNYE